MNLTNTKIWVGNDSALREHIKAKIKELGWNCSGTVFNDNTSFYFYTKDTSVCYSSGDNTHGRSSNFDGDKSKLELFPSDFGYGETVTNKYQIY